jgi:hypothetical protein
MWPVEQTKLIDIYDPKMPTGINAPWVQVYKNQMSEAQLAGYARLLHAQLIIEELVRLGILTRRQRAEARDHFLLNDIPYADERQSYRSSVEYSLTQYGVSFIRAVTAATSET